MEQFNSLTKDQFLSTAGISTKSDLNTKIIARGKEIFKAIKEDKPSIFNKGAWMGKIMDWSMQNENFKVQMFRFVDVFPSLTTNKLLTSHIQEYFGEEKNMPPVLSWGAKTAGILGSLGGAALNKLISANIHDMARQFIIGENTGEAIINIEKLRNTGYACVIDVLGEATLSEEEADAYVITYLKLLEGLKKRQNSWKPLGNGEASTLDWSVAPKVNIAVKPTALHCLVNPQDFEGSVEAILKRVRQIFTKVIELGGFLCIDMESYRVKDITIEVFKRLKLENPNYPYLGIGLQSYLKDTDTDLDNLLTWAQRHNLQISIRLVKGAYWDYETVRAKQNGWEIPVWTIKAETDAAFERHTRKIFENHSICHFACGSHNIRSISSVIEIARELNVPEYRYEFQLLFGMAEPLRRALFNLFGRVRVYCPYGAMLPGMSYLVRRLLENTSNESFLRQSFAENLNIEHLLDDPVLTVENEKAWINAKLDNFKKDGAIPSFRNEPTIDFTNPCHRNAFPEAIAFVRQSLGKTYPLFIDGKDVATAEKIPSINPARPAEVVGYICQAGVEEVKRAIAAANKAFLSWADTEPNKRAEYLLKASAIARRRIFNLAAWQVLEIGKQWDQAYGDVAEAIDFLEYYAREMIRYSAPRKLGTDPGEINQHEYRPKGIAAVIAPWNFPLAISMGMTSAALVTGNTVVYKPSNLTGIIGHQLVDIFREAGIPNGVFNFVPGSSRVMGDYLVSHPDISLIAFTGSVEVGLHIIELAAKVHPGQVNVKKVIAEMGGKNAIIVDDDADLDEAIPHVLYSAFGFQGQKCSACSRVIVTDTIYDRFVHRLVQAAKAYKVGSPEDPSNQMGPVADDKAMLKITEYIVTGGKEGHVLYESTVPDGGGYYVPIIIIEGIQPHHRVAQEEIFGPVLSVMHAKDFDDAVKLANTTPYALTGGVFSRSPKHIQLARNGFRVGNLYINRQITGALVGRQPFGGSRMSGTGTKAGGPDYLLHFMDPRVVTENTMRRGFAPEEEE